MLNLDYCVARRASAGVLLRTIGIASATVLMAGASMAGAFDEQPADTAALHGLKSELSLASSEQRANPATYAQLFFLDRLFAPPAADRYENSNSPRARGKSNQGDLLLQSRDKDGNLGPNYRVTGAVPRKSKTRNQGDDYKLKIAQLLRQAPPVPSTTGPLLLAVSISKQTVTLYDAGVAIAKAPVSTGTASHPTPTGIFSVIEKQWWHRSNLYSAAPMPFMHRITWSGVALHAGDLPGYAASHGCIRLPEAFALRLWGTTKIGARVVITKDELAPIEIAHARLFSLKAKAEPALEPKPEQQLTPEQEPQPAPKAPPENKPQSEEMSISDNAATLSLAARQTERAPERDAARQTEPMIESAAVQAPSPEPEASTPVIVRPPSHGGGWPRVIVVSEDEQLAAANPATDEDDEVADNGIDDETRAALQQLELVDPERTVINGTAEVTISRPGQPAETLLLAVEKMPVDADQPVPASEPRVMLASLDASIVPMLGRAMPNSTQLAARRQSGPREPTVEMSALLPHVLRPGPISVLISRKDQRMYIRKGFEPLFDVPVKIANPRDAIGTYLFTAVAPGKDQATLRWMVLPIETSSSVEQAVAAENRAADRKRSRAPERNDAKVKIVETASAALDRLDLPQEAVDRISDLMSVGATLIVTERGLGRRDAAALDSDFTVQIDHSPVKPRPRPQQQQPQQQPATFFNPLF